MKRIKELEEKYNALEDKYNELYDDLRHLEGFMTKRFAKLVDDKFEDLEDYLGIEYKTYGRYEKKGKI